MADRWNRITTIDLTEQSNGCLPDRHALELMTDQALVRIAAVLAASGRHKGKTALATRFF